MTLYSVSIMCLAISERSLSMGRMFDDKASNGNVQGDG